MAKYKCKSIPLTKMIATPKGFLNPLCNSCKTLDCENDIEVKKISVIGITIETKLLSKKDDSHMVIACDGYISNDAKSKFDNK